MKTLRIFVLLLLCATLGWQCEKEDLMEGDVVGEDIEFEVFDYEPNVFILDNQILRNHLLEVFTEQIHFSNSLPGKENLKVGDILITPLDEVAIGGLILRKVTGIRGNDEKLIVDTEFANFGDAYKNLKYFVKEQDLVQPRNRSALIDNIDLFGEFKIPNTFKVADYDIFKIKTDDEIAEEWFKDEKNFIQSNLSNKLKYNAFSKGKTKFQIWNFMEDGREKWAMGFPNINFRVGVSVKASTQISNSETLNSPTNIAFGVEGIGLTITPRIGASYKLSLQGNFVIDYSYDHELYFVFDGPNFEEDFERTVNQSKEKSTDTDLLRYLPGLEASISASFEMCLLAGFDVGLTLGEIYTQSAPHLTLGLAVDMKVCGKIKGEADSSGDIETSCSITAKAEGKPFAELVIGQGIGGRIEFPLGIAKEIEFPITGGPCEFLSNNCTRLNRNFEYVNVLCNKNADDLSPLDDNLLIEHQVNSASNGEYILIVNGTAIKKSDGINLMKYSYNQPNFSSYIMEGPQGQQDEMIPYSSSVNVISRSFDSVNTEDCQLELSINKENYKIRCDLESFNSCYFDDTMVDERPGENQEYRVVSINGKQWMSQNLRRFKQGFDVLGTDHISSVNESDKQIRGRLYSWIDLSGDLNLQLDGESTISHFDLKDDYEGKQLICPDGWHVPTKREWENLIRFVGENYNQSSGGALLNPFDWETPGQVSHSNMCIVQSGFALREGESEYEFFPEDSVDGTAVFWTSTPVPGKFGAFYAVHVEYDKVYLQEDFHIMGYSCRCVKD